MVRTQDRITRFLAEHSHISKERIEELMLNPTELIKDVGTLLEGREAVEEGLIDAVGGMKDALGKLHAMIEEEEKKKGQNYVMTVYFKNAILLIVLPIIRGKVNGCKVEERKSSRKPTKRRRQNRVFCRMR